MFGLFTVTSRHIFHSAVWLALCLLSVASIYFYLDAEFLGVIQVLVYIGGVITLFVFAIKQLNYSTIFINLTVKPVEGDYGFNKLLGDD